MKKYHKILLFFISLYFVITPAKADYADGFVFPVSINEKSNSTAFVLNRVNPIGNEWHGNGLSETGSGANEGHLGQDYFSDDGSSAGRRVYAVANGKVVTALNENNTYGWPTNGGEGCEKDRTHGWGRVIVIEHEAPPGFVFNTDGSIPTLNYLDIDDRCPDEGTCTLKTETNPKVIYTLYGHLGKADFDVEVGDDVVIGEPIARIGTQDEVPWPPHLHFEMKSYKGYVEGIWSETTLGELLTPQACGVLGVGSGYSYIADYTPERYDPNSFIKQQRLMTFEDGIDSQPIQSSIPGLSFSTTDGFDWLYADIRTGQYAGKESPDPTGPYATFGNVVAWLGPVQGTGRIDFTDPTTSELSLYYSSFSDTFLEAYNAEDQLIDSDTGPGNLATGFLNKLSVIGENISYVIVHDTGNRWIVDNLSVSDILADAKIIIPINSTTQSELSETINPGETKYYDYLNNITQTLRLILHWPGSELKIDIYNPAGILVESKQSTHAPLIITVPNAEIGEWTFAVTGLDVPTVNYPFVLIVYSQDMTSVLVDIKPGGEPNCINPRGKGKIPVAILGSSEFAVSNIEELTISIEGVFPVKLNHRDVNGDNYTDIIMHFLTSDLDFAGLLTDGAQINVSGSLLDWSPFLGSDTVYLAGGPNCS